jgi:hypothetical protein
VIEYQKAVAMQGLSILTRPTAVSVLRETTEWLRLPLQPTTSNSGALLTFAHCPKFQIAGGLIRYWPVRPQWRSLKIAVAHFEREQF